MKQFTRVLTAAVVLAASSMAFAQSSLNVQFQAQYTYPGKTCANICGYATGGREFALVGVEDGMDIVEVTNPGTPVHIVQIPNLNSLWKEIKVYQNFAYVTTEAGGGLQIVNLNALPSIVLSNYTYHNYTGNGAINGQLGTIHALHIDTTKGYCYLFGSDIGQGGPVILDLNVDPYNPNYVGQYQANGYVHDAYVDNDTMYAGHIYDGVFTMYNCANKAAIQPVATQATPTNFTHNTWITQDRHHVLSTDENSNSYLACYDVTNPANIQETDRIQSWNPGSGSIVHNTHVLDNWAITSWYKDGFVITDVTRPNNLINVGWYDTFTGSGNGFEGAWGVFPFFPSGTIVVSNIDEGLFVFSPTYVRACYLEGLVTDSACGTPLNGVTITISTVNVVDQTDLTGNYATGTPIPGTYTVTFSKPGYANKVYTNVVFAPGIVTNINAQMSAPNAVALNGNVSNILNASNLANVPVIVQDANNTFNFTSDTNGDFFNCTVVSSTYTVAAAQWGYDMYCGQVAINSNNSNVNIQMSPGFADEFTFDLGWTVSGNASTGLWERGEPVGTTFNSAGDANPEFDVNGDCTDKCYVTGNSGGSASQDDVDNGTTTITSPVFNLSTYTDPWIHYNRWFFNDGGSGTPNDSLVIKLTDGNTTVTLEQVNEASANNSSWQSRSFRVANYFSPNSNLQLIVTAMDNVPGHLVEAGFDNFHVADSVNGIAEPINQTAISVYPNPFNGAATVQYSLTSKPEAGAFIEVKDITGRVVMTQAVNAQTGTIQLGADFASGVYFVQIVNGTSITPAIRIVKSN
jgi:choice-of-anchor B domain-containing protein